MLRLHSPPRGRHRLVSIQSITLPRHSHTGHSHLLRHSCGTSSPLHPLWIATFSRQATHTCQVISMGRQPHHFITEEQSPLSLGPPSPFLHSSCMLHAWPGPPFPGSTIESLHLPLSPAHSLHSCHKQPQQSHTLASILSTDRLQLWRLELTLGCLPRLRSAPGTGKYPMQTPLTPCAHPLASVEIPSLQDLVNPAWKNRLRSQSA